jgi:hypothetical protein
MGGVGGRGGRPRYQRDPVLIQKKYVCKCMFLKMNSGPVPVPPVFCVQPSIATKRGSASSKNYRYLKGESSVPNLHSNRRRI